MQFTGITTDGHPPYTYNWNFGDGGSGTGQNPTHQYTNDGSYTTTVTVTDSNGITDTDTAPVTISTPTLVADANGPYDGFTGISISFEGSANGGCTPYSYSWTFGDGTTRSGATPTHTYSNYGEYTVTLTVTDNLGATDTDTTTASINDSDLPNTVPTANAGGPYQEIVNNIVYFDGSESYDSDGTIDSYSWNFGDGTTGSGATPTHTYTNYGVYTVTLTVTDNLGVTDFNTTTASINDSDLPNTAPTANAGGPYIGTVNTAIQFSGSATGGTSYTWAWNFGDGGTSTLQNPTHTYTTTGTYTATSTATSGSYTDSDTASVTVTTTGFTFIALPDVQNYNTGYPSVGLSQAQWIANNKALYNIVYVCYEGDLVNTPTTTSQYTNADTSFSVILNSALPLTLIPGNHDALDSLANYNVFFPASRFSGKTYYGGHYGSGSANANNYVLFDASGMSFIAIGLEYNPSTAVIAWADSLLQTYSNRRAIVVEHSVLDTDATWEGKGQTIYDTLKDNSNLFLILCGHMHGENRRTETYNGNTVYILLANYQDYTSGGNGYLRMMQFIPSTNQIQVKTYSPYLNKYETDANSQFTLSYDMGNPVGITVEADGPYSGYVNTAIQFTGSATGETTYLWSWNFGDGGTSTSQNPTHTYTSTGTKTVTLTVTNGSNTASDTASVSVMTNQFSTVDTPPIANAGGPYITSINQTIIFDASASNDPDDTITGYRWDYNNDTVYDTNWSSNPTATYIYTTAGTYTVKLQVKDTLGAAKSNTALVTVSQGNIKLQADAGGPYYDIIGISIQFEGSDSYNLNGTILTYKWSFGDKNTSTSMMPIHTYYKEGNYTVILTVTDDDNNTDTDTTYAIITKKANHPPETPTISGIISSHINTNCNYTIKGSDIDGDKIQYIIDWSDGTNQTISPLLNSGTTFNTSHSWSTGGIYNIIVYTLDENNATSNNQNHTVLIDAYYCGSLGYLIDKNGDGTYDAFYHKTTGKETNIQKNKNEYKIDINDDQEWDYKYNITTNKITEYNSSPIQKSSILNIEPKWIILTIAAVIIIIFLIIILKILIKRKNETPKEIKQEKEPMLETIQKEGYVQTNKIYTFYTNDEKTKKMYEEIDKILSKKGK